MAELDDKNVDHLGVDVDQLQGLGLVHTLLLLPLTQPCSNNSLFEIIITTA
jgi:hypothetical protein